MLGQLKKNPRPVNRGFSVSILLAQGQASYFLGRLR